MEPTQTSLSGQDIPAIGMKFKGFQDADLDTLCSAVQTWANTPVANKTIHIIDRAFAFDGANYSYIICYYELQTDLVPPVGTRYSFGNARADVATPPVA